jgi:hypothetical protein
MPPQGAKNLPNTDYKYLLLFPISFPAKQAGRKFGLLCVVLSFSPAWQLCAPVYGSFDLVLLGAENGTIAILGANKSLMFHMKHSQKKPLSS